jgi:hypothetical protein
MIARRTAARISHFLSTVGSSAVIVSSVAALPIRARSWLTPGYPYATVLRGHLSLDPLHRASGKIALKKGMENQQDDDTNHNAGDITAAPKHKIL